MSFSRTDAAELAFDPGGHARGGLERHLLGELVVVAAIALIAIVAGEVALHRRQHGDVQLRGIALHRVEELIDVLPLSAPIADEEAVLAQQIDRLALVAGELVERGVIAFADSVEKRRDIGRHHQLRVGERVHQEHFIAIRQRHTEIEQRRLHRVRHGTLTLSCKWECENRQLDDIGVGDCALK